MLLGVVNRAGNLAGTGFESTRRDSRSHRQLPLSALPDFAPLSRSILRSALRLQLRRMENAIASKGANGQSLRIVLERIRRRLVALIRNPQLVRVLDQHELRIGPFMPDRARLHVAGHAQMARVGLDPIPSSSWMVT